LVAALAILWTVSVRSLRAAMIEGLETRAEIVVNTIAAGLGEPLAMGELDRLQLLLAETRKADSDVQYLVLVNAEGKAVASTDLASKNQLPRGKASGRARGRVRASARRVVPDASDLFEVATPVRFQGAANGVLRMGVSTSAVSRIAARLALTIAIVGLVTL